MTTKVLLFCGAFDPITAGHMLMLELCIKAAFFDEIRVLPSGIRTDKQYKTTNEHRKAMCQIAIKECKGDNNNLNIVCSDYELDLTKPQDSYFTVKHFQDTEPGKEFYFFIGSDILKSMFDWPHSNELVQITNFLVAYREGIDIDQTCLNKLKKYELLNKLLRDKGVPVGASPASSTEARKELKEGKACDNFLLNPKIMEYIQTHQIYLKPDDQTS